jgi:hypothetical protein
MQRLRVLMVVVPWQAALFVGLFLLAGPPVVGAGERLVFEKFVGAQLTPTGIDPNRATSSRPAWPWTAGASCTSRTRSTIRC